MPKDPTSEGINRDEDHTKGFEGKELLCCFSIKVLIFRIKEETVPRGSCPCLIVQKASADHFSQLGA